MPSFTEAEKPFNSLFSFSFRKADYLQFGYLDNPANQSIFFATSANSTKLIADNQRRSALLIASTKASNPSSSLCIAISAEVSISIEVFVKFVDICLFYLPLRRRGLYIGQYVLIQTITACLVFFVHFPAKQIAKRLGLRLILC